METTMRSVNSRAWPSVALAIVSAALLVLAAAPALAQESRTETEARRVFEAGEVAFSDGRYADALGYFKRAHELSQRPALLFNIALCADRLRDDDAAIDAYQRYLEEVPLATNRREVDDRLEALRGARTRREASAQAVQPERVAQAAATDPAEAGSSLTVGGPRPSDDGGPSFYASWWFWTIVAVVVVGGAVAIGVAASGDDPLQPGDLGGVVFTLGDGR